MDGILLHNGKYYIEAGRVDSTLKVQKWLEHLVEKTWFHEKELDLFVSQVADLCGEESAAAASGFRDHYLEKKKHILLREKEFNKRIRKLHGGKRPMFLTLEEMTKVFDEIEKEWSHNDPTT